MREGGWGDGVPSDAVCLPKSPLGVMQPGSPGDCCPLSACPWEVIDSFLVLLCWRAQLQLYPLHCLSQLVSCLSLLPFRISPPPHQGRGGARLPGAKLLDGVKPQHYPRWILSSKSRPDQANSDLQTTPRVTPKSTLALLVTDCQSLAIAHPDPQIPASLSTRRTNSKHTSLASHNYICIFCPQISTGYRLY